jgi:hypothetical protein
MPASRNFLPRASAARCTKAIGAAVFVTFAGGDNETSAVEVARRGMVMNGGFAVEEKKGCEITARMARYLGMNGSNEHSEDW